MPLQSCPLIESAARIFLAVNSTVPQSVRVQGLSTIAELKLLSIDSCVFNAAFLFNSKDANQTSGLVEQGKPTGQFFKMGLFLYPHYHYVYDRSSLLSRLDASNRRPLFSLIDVTKTPQLWMIFQREFESFLDSNTDTEMHWLAIQPHWKVLADRVTCKEAMNNNAAFVWHDGCGGRRSHGSICSGACLQLMGLTLSSSRLRPQTVFWLPFHIKGVDVLKALRRLLARPRLGMIVSDLKWWLRVSIELLDFDDNFVHSFYDPGTQAWLEDPDSGRLRLVDVVPDASSVINDLSSMGYCLGEFSLEAVFFVPLIQFCVRDCANM